MGGSRSVDRCRICGYVGASGAWGGHRSYRRFGQTRRICGLGGGPDLARARRRADYVVRTACRGVAHFDIGRRSSFRVIDWLVANLDGGARGNEVKADQIDVVTRTMLRHFEEIDHAEKPRLNRQRMSNILNGDLLDGIGRDFTSFGLIT